MLRIHCTIQQILAAYTQTDAVLFGYDRVQHGNPSAVFAGFEGGSYGFFGLRGCCMRRSDATNKWIHVPIFRGSPPCVTV